jgi:hypothetical protein
MESHKNFTEISLILREKHRNRKKNPAIQKIPKRFHPERTFVGGMRAMVASVGQHSNIMAPLVQV